MKCKYFRLQKQCLPCIVTKVDTDECPTPNEDSFKFKVWWEDNGKGIEMIQFFEKLEVNVER